MIKSVIIRIRKHILQSITVILLLYILINAGIIYEYGKKDETRKADAAIVLGAGVWGDLPSPVFRERIHHGIWLYQNGYVKTIIITGGYSPGNARSDAEVAMDYAISKGVPNTDILIEDQSTITLENLQYAKEIMIKKQFSDALLVSDPLHMKRSMLMAADLGIKAYTSPTPTTRYQGGKEKMIFLARELFFTIGYRAYQLFH